MEVVRVSKMSLCVQMLCQALPWTSQESRRHKPAALCFAGSMVLQGGSGLDVALSSAGRGFQDLRLRALLTSCQWGCLASLRARALPKLAFQDNQIRVSRWCFTMIPTAAKKIQDPTSQQLPVDFDESQKLSPGQSHRFGRTAFEAR